jgi:hypothetical protein
VTASCDARQTATVGDIPNPWSADDHVCPIVYGADRVAEPKTRPETLPFAKRRASTCTPGAHRRRLEGIGQ